MDFIPGRPPHAFTTGTDAPDLCGDCGAAYTMHDWLFPGFAAESAAVLEANMAKMRAAIERAGAASAPGIPVFRPAELRKDHPECEATIAALEGALEAEEKDRRRILWRST